MLRRGLIVLRRAASSSSSSAPSSPAPAAREWSTIRTEVRSGGVAVITLHRPKALNALNSELIS